MIKVALLALAVCGAVAVEVAPKKVVVPTAFIARSSINVGDPAGWKDSYNYQSPDGTVREESLEFKRVDDVLVPEIIGRSKWVDKVDGRVVDTTYMADDAGYRAWGDAIPKGESPAQEVPETRSTVVGRTVVPELKSAADFGPIPRPVPEVGRRVVHESKPVNADFGPMSHSMPVVPRWVRPKSKIVAGGLGPNFHPVPEVGRRVVAESKPIVGGIGPNFRPVPEFGRRVGPESKAVVSRSVRSFVH